MSTLNTNTPEHPTPSASAAHWVCGTAVGAGTAAASVPTGAVIGAAGGAALFAGQAYAAAISPLGLAALAGSTLFAPAVLPFIAGVAAFAATTMIGVGAVAGAAKGAHFAYEQTQHTVSDLSQNHGIADALSRWRERITTTLSDIKPGTPKTPSA